MSQANETTNDLNSTWQPQHLRQLAISALEQRLASDPDNVPLLFERACLLGESGNVNAAKAAYINILMLEPAHQGALNNLGTLLYQTGYRTAAQTAYSESVARHPNDPLGHVNLANLLYEIGALEQAREHYQTALRLDPRQIQAHQGLSYVLADLGDEQGAIFHRQKGFAAQPIFTMPYYGDRAPVSVVLLMSAVGGNTPTRWLLDDRVFQVHTVMVEFWQPTMGLPSHQIVFNAVSDADLTMHALHAAKSLLDFTNVPVINPPKAIEKTGRVSTLGNFKDIPGILVPNVKRVSKAQITGVHQQNDELAMEWEYPILLRAPGYHTGRHFIRVDHGSDLARAAAQLPRQDVLVMEYIHARGKDGQFRKYRVMMIDGQLYPLHMAISRDWKVHYFTSEMAENASFRREEEEFLYHMPDVIGSRAMESLAIIQNQLGLNYAGVDFSLNDQGDLVLFEANATMIVTPPEENPIWDYRRPAVYTIIHAVHGMILGKILDQH